jgi:hypothetical protein
VDTSSFNPEAHYAFGCLYAREPLGTTPDLDKPPPSVGIAVAHLRLAAASPDLRTKMDTDPWLSALQGTRAYRTTFLPPKGADFLTLPPLADNADKLRDAGLQTASRLAAADTSSLAKYLGVDVLVAARLIALARLARGIHPGLGDFRTEIVAACLDRGIDSPATLADARAASSSAGLATDLREAIEARCQQTPAQPRLEAWIRAPRP